MKTELFLKNKDDRSLLVVVDMVNGFINTGALADPKINQITPALVDTVKYYLDNHYPVIAFRDCHSEDAKEFSSFPVHCLKGSTESELIDELKPFASSFIDLEKNSTNGFVQPQFLDTFNNLENIRSVMIVGCCTDICVMQFALGLKGYINQNDLDIEMIVPENQVATFDAPGHNACDFDEWSLKLMANAGIHVIKESNWEE